MTGAISFAFKLMFWLALLLIALSQLLPQSGALVFWGSGLMGFWLFLLFAALYGTPQGAETRKMVRSGLAMYPLGWTIKLLPEKERAVFCKSITPFLNEITNEALARRVERTRQALAEARAKKAR